MLFGENGFRFPRKQLLEIVDLSLNFLTGLE